MNRNSQKLRNLLLNLINKQKQDLTGLVSDPDVNFTRNRKIPYENMILSLLTMEGATLTNELLRQFGCSTTTATSSAFVQQRKKILPAALENLFQEFASQTARSDNYRGYKLLAIDGSDMDFRKCSSVLMVSILIMSDIAITFHNPYPVIHWQHRRSQPLLRLLPR